MAGSRCRRAADTGGHQDHGSNAGHVMAGNPYDLMEAMRAAEARRSAQILGRLRRITIIRDVELRMALAVSGGKLIDDPGVVGQ